MKVMSDHYMVERKPPLYKRMFQGVMRLDFFQLFVMIVLLTYGVCFIYGSGHQYGSDVVNDFWQKQLIWIGIGMIFYFGMAIMNYRTLGKVSYLLYGLAVILLVYVLIFGRPIYGAKRWINLIVFNYQPSELAKLAFLLVSSWLISVGFTPNKVRTWFVLGVLAGLLALLIVIEPDLGSALVIMFLFFMVLYFAGTKLRWLLLAIVLCVGAVPAAYPFLKDYHKGRIETFLNPEKDPQRKGWNVLQAQLAVGSGGMTGKGFTNGTIHSLGYLPRTVANNDFIFSVIAEESGFVGSSIFVLFYFLLVICAMRTAAYAPDTFGRILAAGIGAIFFMHSIVNIGMNIRLAPVTGIPLPLVSYGGSFMVSTLIYLGILQSIYLRRRKNLLGDTPTGSSH